LSDHVGVVFWGNRFRVCLNVLTGRVRTFFVGGVTGIFSWREVCFFGVSVFFLAY